MTTAKDLTGRQVANELGVSTGTVRRYIEAETLHAYKLPFEPSSAASRQRAEWRISAVEVARIKNDRAQTPIFDRERYMNALRQLPDHARR